MTADQLINYMIPPLKPADDITRAKQWMDEFRVKELPVVEGSVLLGFISEDLLYDTEIITGEVGAYPLKSVTCQVVPWRHFYDLLKVMKDHAMGMIAVVDNDNFMGVVILEDILNEFANTAIINTEGAIISLQCSLNNYSLAEISKIVEMNGSIVMGSNIRPSDEDPSLIDVVIRLNHLDVNQISSGLAKSGYIVTSSFNTEDKSFDEQERFGLLMKYLKP